MEDLGFPQNLFLKLGLTTPVSRFVVVTAATYGTLTMIKPQSLYSMTGSELEGKLSAFVLGRETSEHPMLSALQISLLAGSLAALF